MTDPFPVTAEQLRDTLRDRAREEFTVYGPPDPTSFTGKPSAEVLQRGELAGPEFMALQNALALVEFLEGFQDLPLDPADPLETVEEQRGKRRGYRDAAAWLRDRLDAGLRGVSV